MHFEVGHVTTSASDTRANQDATLVQFHRGDSDSGPWVLAAVADGLGGLSDGEVASRVAISSVCAALAPSAGFPTEVLLRRAFTEAHKSVRAQLNSASSSNEIATTLLAVAVSGTHVLVAHVGDCRAYLVDAGRIQRLTEDHNLAAEQVRAGLLSSSGAGASPFRHMITRCLGSEVEPVVDIISQRLDGASHLLIATDGAYGPFRDSELHEVISVDSCQDAAHAVVRDARRRGSHDDATVIILELPKADRDPAQCEEPVE